MSEFVDKFNAVFLNFENQLYSFLWHHYKHPWPLLSDQHIMFVNTEEQYGIQGQSTHHILFKFGFLHSSGRVFIKIRIFQAEILKIW